MLLHFQPVASLLITPSFPEPPSRLLSPLLPREQIAQEISRHPTFSLKMVLEHREVVQSASTYLEHSWLGFNFQHLICSPKTPPRVIPTKAQLGVAPNAKEKNMRIRKVTSKGCASSERLTGERSLSRLHDDLLSVIAFCWLSPKILFCLAPPWTPRECCLFVKYFRRAPSALAEHYLGWYLSPFPITNSPSTTLSRTLPAPHDHPLSLQPHEAISGKI